MYAQLRPKKQMHWYEPDHLIDTFTELSVCVASYNNHCFADYVTIES